MSYWRRNDLTKPKAPATLPPGFRPAVAKSPYSPDIEGDLLDALDGYRRPVGKQAALPTPVHTPEVPLSAYEAESSSYAYVHPPQVTPQATPQAQIEDAFARKIAPYTPSQTLFMAVATNGLHEGRDVVGVRVINATGKCVFDQVVKGAGASPGKALASHGISPSYQSQKGVPWKNVFLGLKALLPGRLVFVYSDFAFSSLEQMSRRVLSTGFVEEHGGYGYGAVGSAVVKSASKWRNVWSNTHNDFELVSLEDIAKLLSAPKGALNDPSGLQRNTSLLRHVVLSFASRSLERRGPST